MINEELVKKPYKLTKINKINGNSFSYRFSSKQEVLMFLSDISIEDYNWFVECQDLCGDPFYL